MRKSLLLSLLVIITISFSYAQNTAIGSWRSHLAYTHAVDAYEAGNKIYCATRYGLFYLDKDDRSLNILSKVDGLSEVVIKAFNYDPTNDAFIVAYENTNIDIIKKGRIINVPDIKNKDIIGNKVINGISVYNGLAYINCGFGTVVYDLNKEEIQDTYYLGANGANLSVYEIAVTSDRIFAASDSGILEADINSPNLANYLNWTKHGVAQNYPGGFASAVVSFNGKIYSIINGVVNQYDGTQWSVFPVAIGGIFKLKISNNRFYTSSQTAFVGYDSNLQIADIFNNTTSGAITSVLCDRNNKLWVPNNLNGLLELNNGTIINKLYPAGPFDAVGENDLNIDVLAQGNGRIISLPFGVGDNLINNFVAGGFHEYKNGEWKNYSTFVDINGQQRVIYDLYSVAISPSNNHTFIGGFGLGLLEYNDTVVVNYYDTSNSTIQEAYSNPGSMRVTGLAFDSKNNLWLSNLWARYPISVKRPNGQWKSFEFPGFFVNSELTYVSDLTIDKNNQIWAVIPGFPEILVFRENTNGSVTFKKLSRGEGFGNLPEKCSKVLCITEDVEGKIWVGTDHGVVYYYADGILEPGADIDAQPVKVVEGEFVHPLLENESVTAIAVDGADRKWMGTKNGLWLFSPDGTKQINYFNTTNSPILSNQVNDVKIDPSNGEVVVATDKGVISYMGTATEGGETNAKEIRVFPNPVREDYSGLIAIRGLVRNASVKITDINGNLVYQTIANGGQATWDGKNFRGEKVSTGVYLAYCTDEEGVSTTIEKIVFIH